MPRSLLLALPLTLLATAAFADRIDGSWCFEARHLSIAGPRIVTPGGARIDGLYSRHAFSYQAPAGEAEAGKTVMLRLVNEDTMIFDAAADPQTWKRCMPISALPGAPPA